MNLKLIFQNGCYLSWGQCIISKYNVRQLQSSGLNDSSPDSKVHGANMGPIWGRQDPDEPHVGPMNFVICVHFV